MTVEEVHAAVEAEGLVLHTSDGTATGYYCVSFHPALGARPFRVRLQQGPQKTSLAFATAEEAALCYARHVKANNIDVPRHRVGRCRRNFYSPDEHTMSSADALAAADAEGLLLTTALTKSGYASVSFDERGFPRPYSCRGSFRTCGSFRTAEEAALAIARKRRDHPNSPQQQQGEDAAARAAASKAFLEEAGITQSGDEAADPVPEVIYRSRAYRPGPDPAIAPALACAKQCWRSPFCTNGFKHRGSCSKESRGDDDLSGLAGAAAHHKRDRTYKESIETETEKERENLFNTPSNCTTITRPTDDAQPGFDATRAHHDQCRTAPLAPPATDHALSGAADAHAPATCSSGSPVVAQDAMLEPTHDIEVEAYIGRGPVGKEWDTSIGDWVPFGESKGVAWVAQRDSHSRATARRAFAGLPPGGRCGASTSAANDDAGANSTLAVEVTEVEVEVEMEVEAEAEVDVDVETLHEDQVHSEPEYTVIQLDAVEVHESDEENDTMQTGSCSSWTATDEYRIRLIEMKIAAAKRLKDKKLVAVLRQKLIDLE